MRPELFLNWKFPNCVVVAVTQLYVAASFSGCSCYIVISRDGHLSFISFRHAGNNQVWDFHNVTFSVFGRLYRCVSTTRSCRRLAVSRT